MRALTVRQPWAWAIAVGAKDVENRSRALGQHRDLIAIHASLALDWDAWWTSNTLRNAWAKHGDHATLPGPRSHPLLARGAVIAVAQLTDVHVHRGGETCDSPWALRDQVHLVLADAVQLAQPVPARGALGLWTLPADIEAAVLAQTHQPQPAQ